MREALIKLDDSEKEVLGSSPWTVGDDPDGQYGHPTASKDLRHCLLQVSPGFSLRRDARNVPVTTTRSKDLNEQENSLPAPVLYRRRRGRHAAMTVSTTPRKVPWHVFVSAASHHQRPRLIYLGLLGLHPGDESASGTPWSPTPTPAREWRLRRRRRGAEGRGEEKLGQPA